MKLYAGTSGFAYKEWKGNFYPESISAKEMLHFYAQKFNAVEINNTFYRMPNEKILETWSDQVPRAFVFVLKAPRIITHIKHLRHTEEETARFIRASGILGEQLGALLFQLPPNFPKDYGGLREFLDSLPSEPRVAFEFRDPSWMDNQIFELLRKKNCAVCVADTDQSPAQDIISTTYWGYLRLRRAGYMENDLEHWAEKIISQKWKEVFVFFKHEEEAEGPKLARRFLEISKPLIKA
jgi:uncharacterized protein YecE (DUF72 family)